MPFRRLLLLPALLLVVAAGCREDSEPSEPAADADDGPRVVSLSPSLCRMIEGLSRSDRLVGVTKWCRVEGVPVVGDMRPDVERVLAADPGLVVAGRYPSLQDDLEALRAHGLQVLTVPLDSLDDAREALRTLGTRLDARERATALVDGIDEALREARERAGNFDRAPNVLLVFDVADGYVFTTGGGDHLAEILDAVGARNVAAGGPLTARLPLERVLKLAPDVIVHTAKTDRLPDRDAAEAWWSSMDTLPAVAEGRVHVWPDDSLATHGPGLAGAIRRLSRLVAEAAADGDDPTGDDTR
ncbi:MAG: ABC transporter substrate-binding protein [Myxococcota bacterium]